MRTKLLYLLTGIFMVVALVQCKDSITTTNTSEEPEELSPVELVSPTDSATNQSTKVDLNWKKIKGAKSYQVQLSKSKQFDSTVADTVVEGTSLTTPELEKGTTYFWQVKPVKNNYGGPALQWSETWQFTTASGEAQTVTVDLQSPSDGAQVETTSPSFDWTKASDSADYHYQLSDTQDFSNLVKDTVISQSSVKVYGLNNDQYYWRVDPVLSNATGEWSKVYDFTIASGAIDTTALPAPTLVSPADGAENLALQPTFKWQPVDGADHYILYENEVNGDGSAAIEVTVNDTSYTLKNNLKSSTQYVWSVRAINKDGYEGNLSDVLSFTTTSSNSVTNTVTLASPSDGATGQPTSLTLTWDALSGISDYQVQLATSSSFSSPVVDANTGSTSYDVTGLDNSQTYYWRVQAAGDGDSSNWSSIWNFTTKSSTQSSSGAGSRSGDEAALEALYQAANGSGWNNRSGWSSSGMSLSDNIYGVTTATIDGELRVTKIDLRNNGLTGSIDVPEIGNLKQMTLFAVYGNSLRSQIPPELMSLTNLEYLYLSLVNNYHGDSNRDLFTHFPHELMNVGGGDVHTGKRKVYEDNIFKGSVPAPSNPEAMNLKWFILNWTDSAYGVADGISSIEPGLFDVTTFVGLQIYNNNNVADLPFPSGIGNMTNLNNLALGAEKPSDGQGYLTGTVPSNFGNLPNLRFLRLNENVNLTFDFDLVDLSGWKSIRNIGIVSVSLTGSFPDALLNGSLPDLVGFSLAWPKNSEGVSGTLSAGSTQMQIVSVINNNLSGSIPADFWDNESIINTDFSYNNLTGIGTTDLTGLGSNYWKIRNLRWHHNEIQGKWPNLAWGTNQLEKLSRVQFDHNRYVFADMLWKPSNGGGKTIFELYKGLGLTTFNYSPQKPFGQSQTISASVGGSITIDAFDGVVTHPDNVYQWQKDGSDISGATSRDLTISNLQSSDGGTYRLVVTNPGVPGLTLTSKPIEVNI